ncbi:fumarylacetoacetate hydrolase family protein [Actinoplanes sp. NPDC051859]|uniref:fumarylacetoacetate hydrolase family protein n=1 Tax=Actinoplanes sp. NPDC051859 TaxID=3363909 RepID=UPI0037959E1F
MKIAGFRLGGRESWGLVEDDAVLDLTHTPGLPYADASEALAAETVMDLAMAACGRKPDHRLSDVTLLAPLSRPRRLLWIAPATREPSNLMGALAASGHEVAESGTPLAASAGFAVVIGSPTRRIAVERASEHILGYSCFTRVTTGADDERAVARVFGPWVVTRDDLPRLTGQALVVTVNGEVTDRTDLGRIADPIAQTIASVSHDAAWGPGDVLVFGTAGSRRLRPGDVHTVRVPGVGELVSRVTAAGVAAPGVAGPFHVRCAMKGTAR